MLAVTPGQWESVGVLVNAIGQTIELCGVGWLAANVIRSTGRAREKLKRARDLISQSERLKREAKELEKENIGFGAPMANAAMEVDRKRQEMGLKLVTWAELPLLHLMTQVAIADDQRKPFEKADYQELLDIREDTVHFLIPMLVVDELDGLKEKAPTTEGKTRARAALRTLNELLPHPDHPGVLQNEDMTVLVGGPGTRPRGQVTIELLFDPPNHSRAPIADDEIVERLAAVTPLTGKITFLTFDVGQSMRARKAGLNVKLLDDHHRPPEKQRNTQQLVSATT